jgi:Exopolysaccharide biosynthesis protein YbjH
MIICNFVYAGDEPFANPTNWGGTGLMETPTARVMKEGRYRFGVSQIDPYRYYYGAISPLNGLEIDGRVTQILDVPALTADYGDYKDKAVDLKYQFISEGKYRPAVALGIMDPQGTRLYPSQYIVMSKQIYPFDFSLGFGNGRFGKTPILSNSQGFKAEMFTNTGEWLSDSQFFGGIQLAPSESYAFMVEYSPIRYNEQIADPAQPKYFQDPVPSKFNFGFRWKPASWTEIDLSYQRGNQVGVNLSFTFDIGNPLIPIYDHPYKERPGYQRNPLDQRIARGLYQSGFANIGVAIYGDELWVEAENDKYYYSTRAIGAALRVINDIAPDNIRKIHLILTENGIGVLEFVTSREDLNIFYGEKITVNQFLHLSEIKTDISEGLNIEKKYQKFFDYGLKPGFHTFLNDPSGFFKYRLGVEGWVALHPWRGSSFIAGLEAYPLNTVSTSNEPLSRPVRSDVVPYLQENVTLSMLMFDQIEKFKHEIYGRIAGGILEVEYAGFDGEIAKPLFDGRLMVGVSGSLVKKREPGQPFKFKEDDWRDYWGTAFVNTRLNIPEQEMAIDLKTGQFLAGDKGTRITLLKFFNGVILSAWYSITNTSIFTDGFNNGYHDKGIAVTIPLRLFSGKDTRTAYNFSVSPWTRDVAQDIDHYHTLFDYIGRDTKIYLEKDKKMIMQ